MNSFPRWLVLVALISSALPAADADDRVDYVRDVKPLLKRCYACHGALRQQSGLRLDTPDLIRQGGESGPAIVPGKSAESLVFQAITGANGLERMPPEGDATRLTESEVTTIQNWIDQGAEAPEEPPPEDPRKHWSFQKPERPAIPDVSDAVWVRNPIDAFVAEQHTKRGLQHLPEAAKHALLRRVYLDLIGLPPTRDELRSFLADDSPDAYERVVDQLLDSQRYGERWGRHWMDVWRYSDWAGYGQEIRESQYHIWRWRDWIIESLNQDKPYDQMILEMLAGDEIAPADPNVLRATGYLGRSWYKFNRNVWLDNVVEHCSKAFLGLTINCARCHDHKYDPVAQTDYYRLRAIFEAYDVRYDRMPGEADVTKAGTARVFDKRLEEPTYLFERGNEQQPDKEHPLTAALPELFNAKFEPSPVSLPVESFYPGLAPFVVEETLAKTKADVTAAENACKKARTDLDSARQKLATVAAGSSPTELPNAEDVKKAAEQAVAQCELNFQLATKKAEATAAELASYVARLAAERAKFGLDVNVDAKALALAASKAERHAAVTKAEQQLGEAQKLFASAKGAEKPNDEKSKKAVADAQTKVDQATQAVDGAQKNARIESDQYLSLGDVYPQKSTGRRLALARWIANRDNPLVARVAINHIWLRHFGQPLVPTVFDFGLNGKPPVLPELLDWLAVEFMENGWRMKPIHRAIMLSHTYRLASSAAAISTSNETLDPDNQFLWRMNTRRVEAEIVRDSLLYAAGSLDLTMGGPEIDHQQGQSVLRRSVYFRHAKEKEMVFTKLFDGPGVAECYKRDESVVPQQALALANSPLAKTQARVLAKRLSQSCGLADDAASNDEFVTAAFEHLLTRPPTEQERVLCVTFLHAQSEMFRDPTQLTPAAVGEAGSIPPAMEPHQRARENLVHVLLNHNDFVTVR